MKNIRIIIGAPVRGSDLWDRESEIRRIWKALESSSVLLSAPRRFGKTSVMLNLINQPKKGWKGYYIDTEGVSGPEDFVAELTACLLKDKKFRNLIEKVKRIIGVGINHIEEVGLAEFKLSLRKSLHKNWQDKGKELIGLLKNLDIKTIFIADELPLLVHRISQVSDNKEAQNFLFWMRGLRHIPELQEKVRWVIGGSIGMGKVIERIGAGTKTINDLHNIPIREFSVAVAKEFIKALLRSEADIPNVPKEIIDKFLDLLGIPIPYFIQILVVETINEMERAKKDSLSEDIIERAYEDGVLAAYNRTYFEHYYERLKVHYEPETAEVVKTLLIEVARKDEISHKELWDMYMRETRGKGDKDTFSYLLSELENDFYLVRNIKKDTFRFATKILKDWWLRYHTY